MADLRVKCLRAYTGESLAEELRCKMDEGYQPIGGPFVEGDYVKILVRRGGG